MAGSPFGISTTLARINPVGTLLAVDLEGIEGELDGVVVVRAIDEFITKRGADCCRWLCVNLLLELSGPFAADSPGNCPETRSRTIGWRA